ncbi:BMP family ABC transporter substrate-binding protein [Halalkalibacter oceani]|uniref:BMP family ABC transporter substrate-binding protein n=1 Tax=Halalkalibacter oceani TaxID=1653776 RepID=A0A9X2DT55_9BACI|nr:BMP family ABC transporter substrate-binding protein [Halalkalibacter oceani]MCM3716221.1 BMP family ABC transporter substrate-binding protein [Halalkalibacter oceani]
MRIPQILQVTLLIILLAGCSNPISSSSPAKIGLLLENTIDDQGWNSKGYQGLLNIHTNRKSEVVFKEDMNTLEKVKNAVAEFAANDVQLVFGHGRIFAEFFSELGEDYPDIHFVSFNGDVEGENVTSLQFDSYAMGYFAGMMAASMSETGVVGIIAAFPWQPEVKGFQEGAKVENGAIEVEVEFVESWTNEERALTYFKEMQQKDVDVFYPAGDGYHVAVIEEAKNQGLYAIGFVGDQSDLGESTVLTSTVQHVDVLYELVADQYEKDELPAGNKSYDFQDGVITLGRFSPIVPEEIKLELEEAVKTYIETGDLPESPLT